MIVTLQQLWNKGKITLKQAGNPDAELDARYLLLDAFGLDTVHFLMTRSQPLGEDEATKDRIARYEKMIRKRAARIPLQHIVGTQDFMGMEFFVNKDVLIPRQDTESLVELVLADAKEGRLGIWKHTEILLEERQVLDMCTGSGCIAISLAVLGGFGRVLGADISSKALLTAERNRDKLFRAGNGQSLGFIQSDLFSQIPEGERYDAIVSNPPYIPTEVIGTLEPEVKDHEPILALDGDEDGLKFYRYLAGSCQGYLKPDGMIYMEIGCEQGADVSRLFAEAGYREIQVFPDAAGKDRIVRAVRPE
ncbi:MAG: peptide chain release factor N(5)-glutamine methyltransferase [Lachnospiraceae bacterium]